MIKKYFKNYYSLTACLLILIQVPGFSQSILFGRLTTENGLSNNRVFSIVQDHLGFLWFGTDDGLNRFDGYDFKVYRNDPANPYSLSDNAIRSMFVDRSGYIWIGTKGGELNRYDPVSDRFEQWEFEANGIKENSITSIYEDSKGDIWVGTYKEGLYKFHINKKKFEHWVNLPDQENSLSINYVTSILEDSRNELWISTFYGLNKYNSNKSEQPFTRIYKDNKNENSLSDNLIWTMQQSHFNSDIIWIGTLNGLTEFNSITGKFIRHSLPDRMQLQFGYSISSISEDMIGDEKILWIGTFGGLIKMNITAGYSERFVREDNNPFGINSNQIHALLKDKSGVLWIASDNGLNFFSHKSIKFNYPYFSYISADQYAKLFRKIINSITRTENGKMWFGSTEGLYSIDESFFLRATNRGSSVNIHPEMKDINIWSLSPDKTDNLWIGTYGQGLKQLNLQTGKIKSWEVGYKDYPLISPYKYIKSLCVSTDVMIWIGYWGGGVARLNPRSGHYKIWRNEFNTPGELSYNDVWAIHEDKIGRVWVGTNGGGLNLFEDKEGGYFHHWVEGKSVSTNGLSSNSIYTIYESGKSGKDSTILWIGTRKGLNKFVVDNNSSADFEQLKVQIKNYSVRNGLPDNSIESIIEDDNGNLWIGTGSGISFFNVTEERFINYSVSDGLVGNEFNTGSSFRNEKGLIILGSTNGLNVFHPDKIKNSVYQPPVLITDFMIFNQPVSPGENSSLKSNIFFAEQLELSYSQNVFSFQFAALDFNSPQSNKYSYMMEGFDNEWIYSNSRRFVTYTNLDPGEYIFKIKATNSDGMWNENITTLKVIITPPIWAAWYAYTFYIVVLLSVLLLIRKYELEKRAKKIRERLRKQKAEAEMREMKLKTESAELKARALEQEKEIEKQKIRNRIARDLHDEIGSNISSISLISRMLKDEIKSDGTIADSLSRIESTAKSSVMSIRDIVWFINPSSDSLRDLILKMKEAAENLLKDKDFTFNHSIPKDDIKITPEIKRAIYLIHKETLNNVLKHSEADKVAISISVDDTKFNLVISDNGIGYDINTVKRGNGLNNINSRAAEINAELTMSSNPGSGSSIELSLRIT